MGRGRKKTNEEQISIVDEPLLGRQADKLLATLCKALGHTARLTILRRLQIDEAADCATLVAEVGLAQSTVSQHLAVLQKCGLITSQGDGSRILYRLQPLSLRQWRILAASL